MPAVSVQNPLALPAVQAAPGARFRRVQRLIDSIKTYEGEGFPVRRPFPGLERAVADPFILLDQMGEGQCGVGEAQGAPDHPHRGFETVTYTIEGEFGHRASTGGGRVVANGDTRWLPTGRASVHSGGP